MSQTGVVGKWRPIIDCGQYLSSVPFENRPYWSSTLTATREDLFARLQALHIETCTIVHEAVFTVAQSSNLSRDLPGGHTKNLFLKDRKGRLFLVVALSDAVIDLKTLHKKIDSDRLSFGQPELLLEVLGVPPGSVTPFALINERDLPDDGCAGCRYDAARAAQLSPAGKHGDDQHRT
jgi:prolyl-tRNA editing enzyme YbaK/EbsC (Cys-tRNA(Pro) deacylase)